MKDTTMSMNLGNQDYSISLDLMVIVDFLSVEIPLVRG